MARLKFHPIRIFAISLGGLAMVGMSMGLGGCGKGSASESPSVANPSATSSQTDIPSDARVRQAAVAGLFYPRRKRPLERAVKQLFDYRNSGDTQGDKSAVVGYAAVAFFRPGENDYEDANTQSKEETEKMDKPETPPADDSPTTDGPVRADRPVRANRPVRADVYSKADRAFLLDLARRTISDVVIKRKLPRPDSALIPEKLRERRACFVTLRNEGALRGCIGGIMPEEPLYKAVIHAANRASTRDTRFHAVAADEVGKLHIEISVLSVPQSLEFSSPEDLLEKLRAGIDGVVLKLGLQSATFLPQVWEQLTDKREFLARLCKKARLAAGEWRNPKLKIETYQVEAFEEEE